MERKDNSLRVLCFCIFSEAEKSLLKISFRHMATESEKIASLAPLLDIGCLAMIAIVDNKECLVIDAIIFEHTSFGRTN